MCKTRIAQRLWSALRGSGQDRDKCHRVAEVLVAQTTRDTSLISTTLTAPPDRAPGTPPPVHTSLPKETIRSVVDSHIDLVDAWYETAPHAAPAMSESPAGRLVVKRHAFGVCWRRCGRVSVPPNLSFNPVAAE
jgi:hypothetical protein